MGDDSDSTVMLTDHSDCPSTHELREMRKELRATANNVEVVRRVLMESTPDRGSVLDEQRKHAAQIKELQGSTWPTFVARTFVACTIGLVTAFAFGLIAKGLVLEFLAQAQKLASHP